jgi:hypothetical protein
MQERRVTPRVPKREPIHFKWKNGGVHESSGQTKDISTAGVLLECDTPPKVGSSIEFVVNMPPELGNGQSVRLLCKGTVVRTGTNEQKRTAVGVKISSYEVLEEE